MKNRVVRALCFLTILALLAGTLVPAPGLAGASKSASSKSASSKTAAAKTAASAAAASKAGASRAAASKAAAPSKTAARTSDRRASDRRASDPKAAAGRGAMLRSGRSQVGAVGAIKPAARKPSPPKSAVRADSRHLSRERPQAGVVSSGRRAGGQVTRRAGDRKNSPHAAVAPTDRKGSRRAQALVGSRRGTRPRNPRLRSTARFSAAPILPAVFDPQDPRSLRAEAAVVVDTRTMKVVWSKNPHASRPVASLTKLMTVLVFLDHRVDLGDSMTVTSADVTGAGRSHVRAGNRVAIGDLLRCSLISSDNAATRVLARSTGLDPDQFVRAMNAKARALGLNETRYADPTGLSIDNRSTAADQARLIITAADNPLVSQITSTSSYTFLCGRRIETLTNTNRLLRSRSDIVGCKTGFINSAGYCLALLIGDRDKPYLTTVVLGAPSNSSRFVESSKLIDWALGVVGPTAAIASPGSGGSAHAAGDAPARYNPPDRR